MITLADAKRLKAAGYPQICKETPVPCESCIGERWTKRSWPEGVECPKPWYAAPNSDEIDVEFRRRYPGVWYRIIMGTDGKVLIDAEGSALCGEHQFTTTSGLLARIELYCKLAGEA